MSIPLLFARRKFSPLRLFSAGEQGVWYDPSDLSTLFKLSTDTEANVAVGDPVGKILDKSGRGNHATQTTLTARPILRQDAFGRYYLEFDGVDDCLFTGNINFTATDKMTVWAGVRKLSDAAQGLLIELSASFSTNPGSFSIQAPGSPASQYYIGSQNALYTNRYAPVTYAAPITNIITAIYDLAGSTLETIVTPRINGEVARNGGAGSGAGAINFGNYPMYIGRRGNVTGPFNGRIYSLIVLGAQSTATQISNMETWVNRKTGAY